MESPVPRRLFIETVGAVAALFTPVGFGQSVRPVQAAETGYRVGLIGHTGRGGFGHGLDSMWQNVPRTTVVGIADPAASTASVASFKNRYSEAKFFSEYRQMLEEIRPDLVAIGTRYIDQHAEMAIAAAHAGARGVYMEKPFVRTLEEADAVESACQKTGMRLALAHRNRYHPVLPLVSEYLAAGKFGELLEIRARGKEDTRGGGLDLWVLGSHVLNLATALVGKPLACSAGVYVQGRPAGAGDVIDGAEGIGKLAGDAVHARFEMENGVPLFFDSIRGAGVAAAGFGLQLICSNAVVDFRVDREPLVHVRFGSPFVTASESGSWVPVTSGGVGNPEPVSDIKVRVAGHVAPAIELIEAIEKKRDPLCGLQAGRTTVEMIAAVFESHRLGGCRVEIPLKTRVNPLSLW